MRTLYRAEFFDRALDFQHHQTIPAPTLDYDYIALSESTITLPAPSVVSIGWYVNILCDNAVVFQGVVTGTDSPKKNMKVKIKPLLALLDVELCKTTAGAYTSTEGWLAAAIRQEFIDNSDAQECIPGLTVAYITSTTAVPLELEGNVHKLWEVAKKAFELAQIVISVTLFPQSKKIIAEIAKVSISAITIESELAPITVKSFLVSSAAAYNKVVVYNKDDYTQQYVAYAENYAAPTVKSIKAVSLGEDESFAEKAQEAAAAVLETDKFNNCIELAAPSGCRVLPQVSIGQCAHIIRQGIVYTAYLTAIVQSDKEIIYTFGRRRRELTKRLRTEKL